MATQEPESPYLVIGGGVVTALVAAAAFGMARSGDVGSGVEWALIFVAALLSFVGSVMVGVGIVAAGVRLGFRLVEHERRAGERV